MSDEVRGIGTTTQQMRDAPHGALFIWPVDFSLDYPKRLARELGRIDIVVVSLGDLERPYAKLQGRVWPAVVLDHACRLTEDQQEGYEFALTRVRPDSA
jgi:hypothetical protein